LQSILKKLSLRLIVNRNPKRDSTSRHQILPYSFYELFFSIRVDAISFERFCFVGNNGMKNGASKMKIERCPSCEGFGWSEDEFTGESEDCAWCAGIGYVYRDAAGLDQQIPAADLLQEAIANELEALETARMREMGYSGEAKKPWQQEIRKDTKGGANPYED
jgi:hypothetical protein